MKLRDIFSAGVLGAVWHAAAQCAEPQDVAARQNELRFRDVTMTRAYLKKLAATKRHLQYLHQDPLPDFPFGSNSNRSQLQEVSPTYRRAVRAYGLNLRSYHDGMWAVALYCGDKDPVGIVSPGKRVKAVCDASPSLTRDLLTE